MLLQLSSDDDSYCYTGGVRARQHVSDAVLETLATGALNSVAAVMAVNSINYVQFPTPFSRPRLSKKHAEIYDSLTAVVSYTAQNVRASTVELIELEGRYFPGLIDMPVMSYDVLLVVNVVWKDHRRRKPCVKREFLDGDGDNNSPSGPPRKRARVRGRRSNITPRATQ